MEKTGCFLCPRSCGVNRREKMGVCGMSWQAVVARAALHHWEEPCISGERGSGTVFFSGCNLRCIFCQNEEISHGGFGQPVTTEGLRSIFRDLVAQGAHNINLVNPTHFAYAIAKALEEKPPVPLVYNCSGYEGLSGLHAMEGKVDVYLPDLKYIDSAAAKKYSGAEDYFPRACEAIDEMVRQTGSYVLDDEGMITRGVLIRHLLLPGRVGDAMRIMDFVADRYGNSVLFSLMGQYVPCGSASRFKEISRRVTPREYARAKAHFLSLSFKNGYVQSLTSAKEAYIPPFDLTGVRHKE